MCDGYEGMFMQISPKIIIYLKSNSLEKVLALIIF